MDDQEFVLCTNVILFNFTA